MRTSRSPVAILKVIFNYHCVTVTKYRVWYFKPSIATLSLMGHFKYETFWSSFEAQSFDHIGPPAAKPLASIVLSIVVRGVVAKAPISDLFWCGLYSNLINSRCVCVFTYVIKYTITSLNCIYFLQMTGKPVPSAPPQDFHQPWMMQQNMQYQQQPPSYPQGNNRQLARI
jgi:hypothetical protein